MDTAAILIAVGCCSDAPPRARTPLSEGPKLVVAMACPSDSAAFFPLPSALRDADSYEIELRALGEGPLCASAAGGDEIYRVLWLPSFGRATVVRAQQRGDTAWVVGRQGADSYRNVTMGAQRRRAISMAEWVQFRGFLDSLNFWREIAKEPMEPNVMHADGEVWLVEGVRDNAYHAISRWTPGNLVTHPRLQEAGRFLFT